MRTNATKLSFQTRLSLDILTTDNLSTVVFFIKEQRMLVTVRRQFRENISD